MERSLRRFRGDAVGSSPHGPRDRCQPAQASGSSHGIPAPWPNGGADREQSATADGPLTVDTTAPNPGTLRLASDTDSGNSSSDFISRDKSFDLSLSGQESGAPVTYPASEVSEVNDRGCPGKPGHLIHLHRTAIQRCGCEHSCGQRRLYDQQLSDWSITLSGQNNQQWQFKCISHQYL